MSSDPTHAGPPAASGQPPLDAAALQSSVRRGIRAAAWTQAASQLVSIAVLAILMRLVGPQGYGLLGMVFPLLNLLRLFTTLGLNVATIQRAELSAAEVSSLFWLNAALGAVASLATAALAPALAVFYGQPAVTGVALAMAATPLLTALGAQHQALLERHLRIGAVARLRLAAQIVGGLSSIAAATGAGLQVGALVLGQYVELLALAGLAWWTEPWRPGRPGVARSAWGMLRFGGQYTASQLVFFVAANLDKVLVGLWFGDRALGYYAQAFQIAQKPVLLVTTPLTGVLLPALSRAVGDRQTQTRLLQAFFRLTAALLWPCGVGLLIVAPEAMLTLGGPRWLSSGPLLRALALTLLAQGLVNLCGSVLAAQGRADRLLRGAALLALAQAGAYAAALALGPRVIAEPLGQLQVLAWAHSFVLLAVGGPYVAWCWQSAGVAPRRLLAALWPALWASAAMGAVVLGARFMALWLAPSVAPALLLSAEVLLGAAAYVLFARREVGWGIAELGARGHG